jgi:hypothetical protein
VLVTGKLAPGHIDKFLEAFKPLVRLMCLEQAISWGPTVMGSWQQPAAYNCSLLQLAAQLAASMPALT